MEIGKASGAGRTGGKTASACSQENRDEICGQEAGESSSQANLPQEVSSGNQVQERSQELAPQSGACPTLRVRTGATSRSPEGVRDCMLSAWVAHDPVSLALLAQVRRVASNRSSLLITGEPGVGKDLLASIIHYLGPEPDTPLLRLDCAAFPSSVLEAELFGEERLGTWTRDSRGRMETAGHGTLVLDEIGALSLPLQLRLLRAIEEGRFQPNGSFRFVPNNVRIVALSTSELHRAVSSRSFREDLYYRLSISAIMVPPLRRRPGDIAPLCEHFVARASRFHRRSRIRFSPAALAILERYSWPANVSELRALVERFAASFSADEVSPDELPAHIAQPAPVDSTPRVSLQEVERNYIAEVLKHTHGRKSAAAGILGISRKTLLEKRKRYGLD